MFPGKEMRHFNQPNCLNCDSPTVEPPTPPVPGRSVPGAVRRCDESVWRSLLCQSQTQTGSPSSSGITETEPKFVTFFSDNITYSSRFWPILLHLLVERIFKNEEKLLCDSGDVFKI